MYDGREFVSLYDRLKISSYGFRHGCIQLFTVLLLFAFQQSVLYYTIYYLRNEPRLLYLAIFDILIEDYLSFVGFYLTPVIYILFNRISNRFLFNREKRNVNVDELLHSDLALATALDLWDIVIMVNHLFRRYRSVQTSANMDLWEDRNFVAYAFLCTLSMFLLGFVSPTVDSDLDPGCDILEHRRLIWYSILAFVRRCLGLSADDLRFRRGGKYGDMGFDIPEPLRGVKSKSTLKGQYLDMFTIAKYTFLIGFSLVDIPFFVYRVVLLARKNVFSLMLYKNLLGIFIRPYRLTLSQLAERDSAKGWQSAFFEAAPLFKDPFAKRLIQEDLKNLETPSAPASERQLSAKLTNRNLLKGSLSSASISHTKSYIRNIFTRAGSTTPQENLVSRVTKKFPTSQVPSEERINEVPSADKMVARLRFTSSHPSGSYHEWSSRVSEPEAPVAPPKVDENAQQVRLSLLRNLRRHREVPVASMNPKMFFETLRDQVSKLFAVDPRFAMEEDEFVIDSGQFDYLRMLIAVGISLISRILIVIFCYSRASEVRSPRFIFGSTVSTATGLELLVYGMVVFAPILEIGLFYRVQCCNLFDCICFGIQELLQLCSFVTCVCCLRGFVADPGSVFYAMQVSALVLWPVFLGMLLLVQGFFGSLTVIRLVYLLCKYSACPVGLHHKPFCLDIMKSTMLADRLLHVQWSAYLCSALFRALCCSFSPTKTEVIIIIVDLLIRLTYVIFCQTMRTMMLRKFEVHYLIMRMSNAITSDYMPPSDTFSLFSDSNVHFVTPSDVESYIKDQGLLSSPGIIFPAFL
uniref:Uncharacterized protein n=1 Tax=Babesia bovis TaxID=5865 RepID=A7AWA9_BABBO|eukprot:XP_001608905.1 hypothetical protein [Babesia bovis T2Bo]